MDPRRALTERNAHFTRGPRFFREGDAVMFEFIIDAGNVLGPRPATKADSVKHDDAWVKFQRAEALSALAREDADVLADAITAPEQKDGPPAKRAYRRKTLSEGI